MGYRTIALCAMATCLLTGLGYTGLAKANGSQMAIYSSYYKSCLDVQSASIAPGAPVQNFACAGTPNQLWNAIVVDYDEMSTIVRFESANSGLCMDLAAATAQVGVAVVQAPCDPASWSQRWKVGVPVTTQTKGASGLNNVSVIYTDNTISLVRTITNYGSGLCLNASANGQGAVQWTCNQATQQNWRLPPL